MPIPMICLDTSLRQFAAAFRGCFSKPQARYFEIVLLALLLCEGPHTLSGLRRQIAERLSVAGLSRFLAKAPWSEEEVALTWRRRFREQMAPRVVAEQERRRAERLRQPGRPPAPVVTGYLIGDDSTMPHRQGKKMEGLGRHHSTTAGTRVVGHSLVQGLYVLQGRRCPLAPLLYRQKVVCAQEGVPFRSKIDLMEETIHRFVPVPGTQTHVLLDSWYTAKRLWKAARQRDFLITSGLKSNRSLRVPDPDTPRGWRWQTLTEYAAGLRATDYRKETWPSADGGRAVWVHVVSTRVRTLYRCQVIIVRESLSAPLSEARYWASSDLTAAVPTLLGHIAARWAIEVLFSDTKDLLGLDQYQLMSATALLRFWTLVLATYTFLDEERERRSAGLPHPLTLGETRQAIQRTHRHHFLVWLYARWQAGATPDDLGECLAA
jgi:DDE superfamily endonuclease